MSRLITNSIRSTSASADAITMDGSGNVTFPANATCSGTATGFGKILQVVSVTKTDVASNSTASQTWWSYTDSSLRVTITPTSASNKILITGSITIGVDSQQSMFMRLEKNGVRLDAASGDADGNKSRCMTASQHASNENMPHPNKIINYLDTAGDTNSRYYNFGLAHVSGSAKTIYINRGHQSSDTFYIPLCSSTITAMEIAA
tara:strand:- start:723 stop:1334 length:612 start_codon:yes stop_codon:yes gene_type:complete